MSVAEIIRQLPKLSAKQRSVVSRRLRELEEEDGALFLREAADAIFQGMETGEKKHARRKTR